MFTAPRLAAALAAATLVAVPAAAQSPEFRTDDLPGATIHRATAQPHRTDTVELTLAPAGQDGSRLEYKVHMAAGDVLLYSLATSAPLVAEFHGESDANKAVMFYREDPAASATYGHLVAPMTGIHGWYLANTGDVPVAVRLNFSGNYAVTPGVIELRPRPRETP
ncbi:hypothetical protein M3P36_06490 [Altererythrobacter sp. KTW20L]|uniref:hypothetical protein n=1 Tax=Altererythrobacter sp. KTW20L TaxID=2942210 RepID=UPI0020BF5538|nr:hypothetical protein [Altererythrobacter sp. KTW20L]MCL6250693.1 hypothetical protein [Altererythrobacter sp. KTW20L]